MDKQYFQGLASPSAAALVTGFVWLVNDAGFADGKALAAGTLTVTLMGALLMVSKFRYYSFKTLDFRGRQPFVAGLLVVLIFVLISLNPALMLFLMFMLYALSGPVLTLMYLHRHRASRRLSHEVAKHDDDAKP